MTDTSTKKFDHVVSFGCSLAYGDELINRNKRYSKIIADSIGAKLVDHSVVSLSNEIISQNVINHLLANKHKGDPSRTLVIVEWSFASRLNICGKNNRYYVIAHYNINTSNRKLKLEFGHKHVFFNDDFDDLMDVKFFYDTHTNLTYMMYNLTKCIHHAQTFLKNKGYNYVFLFGGDNEKEMITSVERFNLLGLNENDYLDCYPYFRYMLEDIDTSLICPTAFVNYARSNKFKFGPFEHPLEDGHIAYSGEVMKFIESKYGQQTLRGSKSGVS